MTFGRERDLGQAGRISGHRAPKQNRWRPFTHTTRAQSNLRYRLSRQFEYTG